jgi:hypothetical protein
VRLQPVRVGFRREHDAVEHLPALVEELERALDRRRAAAARAEERAEAVTHAAARDVGGERAEVEPLLGARVLAAGAREEALAARGRAGFPGRVASARERRELAPAGELSERPRRPAELGLGAAVRDQVRPVARLAGERERHAVERAALARLDAQVRERGRHDVREQHLAAQLARGDAGDGEAQRHAGVCALGGRGRLLPLLRHGREARDDDQPLLRGEVRPRTQPFEQRTELRVDRRELLRTGRIGRLLRAGHGEARPCGDDAQRHRQRERGLQRLERPAAPRARVRRAQVHAPVEQDPRERGIVEERGRAHARARALEAREQVLGVLARSALRVGAGEAALVRTDAPQDEPEPRERIRGEIRARVERPRRALPQRVQVAVARALEIARLETLDRAHEHATIRRRIRRREREHVRRRDPGRELDERAPALRLDLAARVAPSSGLAPVHHGERLARAARGLAGRPVREADRLAARPFIARELEPDPVALLRAEVVEQERLLLRRADRDERAAERARERLSGVHAQRLARAQVGVAARRIRGALGDLLPVESRADHGRRERRGCAGERTHACQYAARTVSVGSVGVWNAAQHATTHADRWRGARARGPMCARDAGDERRE